MFHGDRVNVNGSSMEILEDHDEIEVLQSELDLVTSEGISYLNTFEMRNFNVRQSNDQERRFAQIDKTIGRWLQQHIRSIGHTGKSQIPERNIDLNLPVTLAISTTPKKTLPHQQSFEQTP